MRIIAKRTLDRFWQRKGCEDAEHALKTWFEAVSKASWQNANQVKVMYGNASIIGNGRIVFNIAGNKYRLIVSVDYNFQLVFIKFVGTHKEYDKVDAETVEHR